MGNVAFEFSISGRIDGWIRRLAAESELSYDDAVRALLSAERVARVHPRMDRDLPPLGQWGYGRGPWRRTVVVSLRIDEAVRDQLRAVAEGRCCSMADVARYLVMGGRTNAELYEAWRSGEPLVP